MLADLTPIIRRGILDNTTQDTIHMLLWCDGEDTPVVLDMPGNLLQDVAGCCMEFRLTGAPLPEEESEQREKLISLVYTLVQSPLPLIAGDMTLSRRFPLPTKPKRMANFLSLEFFLSARVRFLIETEEFECNIAPPKWECSAQAAAVQELVNMSAMHDHVLHFVNNFRSPSLAYIGTAEMPSCRWDYALNRAEAYMLIAPSVRAKYAARPGARAAESFVLDRALYLERAADLTEQGYNPDDETAPNWDLVDFLEPEHAKLARFALQHPLFTAAAKLSRIIQTQIISKFHQYSGNATVERLLESYSGLIPNVLATIMLAREGLVRPGAITSRAESLCIRVKQQIQYGEALKPAARVRFIRGAEELLARLREFLYTLQQ